MLRKRSTLVDNIFVFISYKGVCCSGWRQWQCRDWEVSSRLMKIGKRGAKHRFDYKAGGRNAWLAKVDALPLSVLTAAAVQRWKLEYIARAGSAPDARRRAENSAASLIRCARALFSEKAREFAAKELILPDPLPFDGVKLPKKGNTTYQSRIDAGTLIATARAELTGEPFKIFILALLCGLRKREIDLLIWSQVDFEKDVIRMERTEFFQPKSEVSAGEVDLDPETITLLRGWKATATGPFVIESTRPPRHEASGTNYRCTPHFDFLYAWLKMQGITARKPQPTSPPIVPESSVRIRLCQKPSIKPSDSPSSGAIWVTFRIVAANVTTRKEITASQPIKDTVPRDKLLSNA